MGAPPARRHWPGLANVALGVVVGFPLCSALALRSLPAAHGAVVTGLLPAATAAMAMLRAGERPPCAFWDACAAGVVAVQVFDWGLFVCFSDPDGNRWGVQQLSDRA